MKIIAPLLLCTSSLFIQDASAGPLTDRLSTCLADNTTGRDRKDLIRWTFLAMTAHPELHSLTSATATTRNESDKTMAALVTRLLTNDCKEQTKEIVALEGNAGMFAAFKSLGEVAMRELISNPEVASSFGEYAKLLDQKKFESVLGASK